MTEQMSLFDLIGEPETPKIPPERQKEGTRGWIIDVSAVLLRENGFKEDVTCVCTRPVKFRRDTEQRADGWWQTAETTHGPTFGWSGGLKEVYAARPTWKECVEYARRDRHHPAKVMYLERDGNFRETWGYENGITKG